MGLSSSIQVSRQPDGLPKMPAKYLKYRVYSHKGYISPEHLEGTHHWHRGVFWESGFYFFNVHIGRVLLYIVNEVYAFLYQLHIDRIIEQLGIRYLTNK